MDTGGSTSPTHEGAILKVKRSRHRTCLDVWRSIYSKPLGRGQHQHGSDAARGVVDGRAHWPHVVNTIEPSVCGGDAA